MEATAVYAKMEGQGLYKTEGKKLSHLRDFGATRMNMEELQRGIKRALKRAKLNPEKASMYHDQAAAYRDRINWYHEKG